MKTKARIYKNPGDGHGIVLSGEVVSFFLGTKGWNLVMKDSEVCKEHPELFEVIMNGPEKLKGGNRMVEPRSKAEITGDTVWIGFLLESEVRVQIFNEGED